MNTLPNDIDSSKQKMLCVVVWVKCDTKRKG